MTSKVALPVGAVEQGETLEQAVIRETKEETV
ncbi:NUDIX domain-containing protein [Peribacillus frigoritolerans]